MSLLTDVRNDEWIGCIDFGTAFSKCAMVRAKQNDQVDPSLDIKILDINIAKPALYPSYLLPSTVFVSDDRLYFGEAAENVALRYERTGRMAFSSPKQYLSSFELSELDAPLESEIDPTNQYTARNLLKLFLAHLLQCATIFARRQNMPWPVRLRVARPAWRAERAQDGEKILKEIVRDAFELVDILGSDLAATEGLSHKSAQRALARLTEHDPANVDSRIFVLSNQGTATVLEATAVAVAGIRELNDRRRVVAVADIGAGTSDFGAFVTGLPGHVVVAELATSSRILHKAGDYLDMQLRRFIMDKAGLLEDDPAGRGTYYRLRARQRRNKEVLFSEQTLVVELGDYSEEINLTEFLEFPHVQQFEQELWSTFQETLNCAVGWAKSCLSPHPPVEIMLTGGGARLPMAKRLLEEFLWPWQYQQVALELPFTGQAHASQLAVAIGGAMRDLPRQVTIRQM